MTISPLLNRLTTWAAFVRIARKWRRRDPLSGLQLRRPAAGSAEPCAAATDFILPRVGGGECSLSDYRGRRVLLVFMQPGGSGSHNLAESLNRVQRSGGRQVLAVMSCRRHEAALWADDVLAAFPVLVETNGDVSAAYSVPGVPFAVAIDEKGRIADSGFLCPQIDTSVPMPHRRPHGLPGPIVDRTTIRTWVIELRGRLQSCSKPYQPRQSAAGSNGPPNRTPGTSTVTGRWTGC